MVLLLAISTLAGCTAMHTMAENSIPLATDPQTAGTPSISMEIRAAGKKPRIETVTLDGSMTVQQSLEKTNLTKAFRRMDIQILRMAGDQRLKMDVKYEHNQAQVDPLYDYALHPNDHVIVREVTKTTLDDMMESLGPLGPAYNSPAPRRYKTM